MTGGKLQVLITGGRGYVGQWIVDYLADHDLYMLNTDITDVSALGDELKDREFDVVVHLAASHATDEDTLNGVNVIGTQNLIRTIDLTKLKRFIFLSSIHVYGTVGGTITELTPTDPTGAYGRSKLKAEEIIKQAPVESVIFRLSHAYGAPRSAETSRWKLFFNDICKQVYQHQQIKVHSAANTQLDMIWLDYVRKAILKASEGKIPSGVYNLGSGSSVSLKAVATEVKVTYESVYKLPVSIQFVAESKQRQKLVFDCSRIQQYIGRYPIHCFKQEALNIFQLLDGKN